LKGQIVFAARVGIPRGVTLGQAAGEAANEYAGQHASTRKMTFDTKMRHGCFRVGGIFDIT